MTQSELHPVVTWLRETVTLSAELTTDSRAVGKGDVFFAYPGAHHDGRAFIRDAIARGAAAVVWEGDDFSWDLAWQAAQRSVFRLKSDLSLISAQWYAEPSKRLHSIGITGTSGKTSCALWIAQAFAALGHRPILVGTLGMGFLGDISETGLTTPDSVALQRALDRMVRQGADVLAMEVSSIGLAEGRVDGMHYDIALFTNLSRDHLDYHGTQQAYEAAKAKLFGWKGLVAAVVNLDDAAGRRMAAIARANGARVWGFSVHHHPSADIHAHGIHAAATGLEFTIEGVFGQRIFRTQLLGDYNVSNLLATLSVLLASDISIDAALDALSGLSSAPGRLEQVPGAGGPLVLVDYAHKPDALEHVLLACAPIARARRGKLVVLFGCGGNRDAGKRPLMGEIATRLADHVIVTSDNPRFEDPDVIAQSILSGVQNGTRVELEIDRGQAIRNAIGRAQPHDVIVVAGKGHERYQEINGVKIPFSDVEQAQKALQLRAQDCLC